MLSAKSQSVENFIAALEHPYQAEITELRQIILGADPRIAEEIKWNAPSLYTTQHFATFQLRAKKGVQIILHLGTKVRETATTGITVPDPEALLTWLAKDRASVTFQSMDEINAKRAAFTALIQAWIALVV